MDQNTLILVELHFHTNSHNFNRDGKFTIIERIEIDTNMKLITEKERKQLDKKIENLCAIWI